MNEKKTCPKCGLKRIYFRKQAGNYKCYRCGSEFTQPAVFSVRARFCCPTCNTYRTYRRVTKNDYYCTNCKKSYSTPNYRLPDVSV